MKTFLTALFCGFLALAASAQSTDSLATGKNSISQNEFARLLQNINTQDTDSLKTEALKNTFINTNYFTTAQIRKLLSLVAKDSDKLALARSAYDRVTDPRNFAGLVDLFNSNIYQREFTLWVNKQGFE